PDFAAGLGIGKDRLLSFLSADRYVPSCTRPQRRESQAICKGEANQRSRDHAPDSLQPDTKRDDAWCLLSFLRSISRNDNRAEQYRHHRDRVLWSRKGVWSARA